MAYYPLLKNLPPNFDVLIPFYQFENELERELALNNNSIFFKNEKIFIVENLFHKPIWSQDWWPKAKSILSESKSQMFKFLKSKPVLGHFYDSIQSKIGKSLVHDLRNLEKKRIDLNSKFNFKYFSWTAFEDGIIFCDNPFSRFPIGWHEFNEDKKFPPNRAYLKLWELFTVHPFEFNKKEAVIDVGSSPGGWSWVLSQYFLKVYSIDKAELDSKIMYLPNIEYINGDAFKIQTENFKDCTWIFSDIICAPLKSYELIQNWLTHSSVKNFVCTLKFKGNCDFDILKKCLLIEGSQLIHLYQNKNEVTWFKVQP